MYDKDSSGEIDLAEMVEIFCLMYAVQVPTPHLSITSNLKKEFFWKTLITLICICRAFQKQRQLRGLKRYFTLWIGRY